MQLEDQIRLAAEILANSRHAVALTGAGHSTPSGVPDFRSPGSGLWKQADPMEVASLYGFQRNPQAFYDWIRPLAKKMMEAEPNAAHVALAVLEQIGIIKAVITQNIDELHHRAGSKRVLELHGSVRQATCTGCGKKVPGFPRPGDGGVEYVQVWPAFVASGQLPHCPSCGGLLRPDVVLFGELLPMNVLLEAQQEADRCDVMLVAGSSLEVYPAAGLPLRAKEHGAEVIVVNYEPTHMDTFSAVVLHENVASALPQIAAKAKEIRGSR